MRVWRLARRIVTYGAVFVLILVIGLIALLYTPWFKRYARDLIVRQSHSIINGDLSIGRLSGNFFSGLVLEDVAVQQGSLTSVRIGKLVVHYSVSQVARGNTIAIDRLEVTGLKLAVVHLPSGGLNLGSLIKKRAPSGKPRRTIDIRQIQLDDAELTFDRSWGPSWMRLPLRITGLTSTLGLLSREGLLSFPIKALRANAFDPTFSVRNFAGEVAIESDGWRIRQGTLDSAASSLLVSSSFKSSGYDVTADASTFDFPEMARVVPGLRTIDVPARVQLKMTGPQNALNTQLTARSSAGNVNADVVLDATVPGWKGKGRAELTQFDISRWLPTDVKSDLTGVANFDLLLGLGRHFPRGPFSFTGPHVVYAGYEAREFTAKGTLIVDRVLVDRAIGNAYGSAFQAAGWIDLPEPYGFHLSGRAAHLDLRRLPASVPVPRMRSNLTFAYDSTGRFHNPILVGTAAFEDSTFLDAQVASGSRGAIDTSGERVTYSANGTVRNLDVGQIGEEFDLPTLREPQFAGTVAGDFDLTGAGASLDDLTIDVKGANVAARLFGGLVKDTSLDLQVRNDSLAGSGRGQFADVDAAILTADSRVTGTLNGAFDMNGSLPGLFGAGFDSHISQLSGSVSLSSSRVKGVEIEHVSIDGSFDRGLATLKTAEIKTAFGAGSGKGTIAVSRGDSDFTYELAVSDAARLKDFLPVDAKGAGIFSGRAIGPVERTKVDGTFTASRVEVAGVSALSASGKYHIEGTASRLAEATMSGDATASFVSAFGRSVANASGKFTYRQQQLQGELEAQLPDSRVARMSGKMVVHPEHNELHVASLQVELGNERWVLNTKSGSPIVSWSESKLSARDLVFDTGKGVAGRISIAGDVGRAAPAGDLSIKIEDVPLQDLRPLLPSIAGYRGRLNATVTIGGTVSDPTIAANGRIDEGGVREFTFQSITASGRWTGESITGDVRIDQSPGVWLTASGSVPVDLFSSTASSKAVDVAIRSSTIQLALLEGLTTSVRNVVGTAEIDLKVKGQANDPQFDGFLNLQGTSFEVPATGIRYRNGTAHVTFVPDAVKIESFHLEDSKGNPIDLTGTAGTRALRLAEIGFEVAATRFEVLHNDLGQVVMNGVFTVSGTLAAPTISGDLALDRANLDASTLLLRLQRPYAVVTADSSPTKPAGASTPGRSTIWDNLTLRLRVLTANNLNLRGENMHLSRETLASLGDISVTLGGDMSIRKAPHEPIEVAGTLQTIRGTYAYQGRRFTIERDGTVRFVGDSGLDPLISITATRTVSSVVIRAALHGQASAPELELTSVPALEESDILSLLLFNQPANELATSQRNELAIQAATLASGFVVSPAVSAMGEKLGLDFLQLEPIGTSGGTSFRLSAGREIWKGLFLTYAREFSSDPFNELLAEYELARYLRLRASGTDASGSRQRNSLFRRVERFGIDVIFFFSY
ncbi:MAG TPA: translocation/assembly module TamB domain-containing protein [Vicinamibacterales bacterium]|nr:translocation/assembly module TamB domain-containing protein [Vicinamibacterales bacterium]